MTDTLFKRNRTSVDIPTSETPVEIFERTSNTRTSLERNSKERKSTEKRSDIADVTMPRHNSTENSMDSIARRHAINGIPDTILSKRSVISGISYTTVAALKKDDAPVTKDNWFMAFLKKLLPDKLLAKP